MNYDFLKLNSGNTFYPVTIEEIREVENDLEILFPKELKDLYLEVGYGFIKGSKFNINRILDPYSIRDFRKRKNDFEFFPDIEIYDEYELNKLIFFEVSSSALVSIGFGKDASNAIYYFDTQIATSLKDFLNKMQENDKYYFELI